MSETGTESTPPYCQGKSFEDFRNEVLESPEIEVRVLNDSVARIILNIEEKDGHFNNGVSFLLNTKFDDTDESHYEFNYKGKIYKPELVAHIGKDVETLRMDSLYKEQGGLGLISQISVSKDNKHFCLVNGVLYSSDTTRLVWCPSVRSGVFQVPASVRTIGAGAFFECGISNVLLPDGLVRIEECAFCNCKKLGSVVLPASVEVVEASAFDFQHDDVYGYYHSSHPLELEQEKMERRNYTIPRNSKLRKVGPCAFPYGKKLYFPNTVAKLPEGMYNPYIELEKNNPAYVAEDGILFSKDRAVLLSFPYYGYSSYTLPSTVRTIAQHAFANNHSLKTLDLGDNVKIIETDAFSNCAGVARFVLPASVDSLGWSAWRGEAIEVDDGNSKYSSVGGVLYSKDKKTLLAYPGGKRDTLFEVPVFVHRIAPDAFFDDTAIKSIRLHDKIESVEDCGLSRYSVREVIVLTDVEKWGNACFGRWSETEIDKTDPKYKLAYRYAWGFLNYENDAEAYFPDLMFEKYGSEGIKITLAP